MVPLTDFLYERTSRIDCHANLFGPNVLHDKHPYICLGKSVIMVNNSLPADGEAESLEPYYASIVDRRKAKGWSKFDYRFVSCIGKDLEETKKIYQTDPDMFSFFGEVKCRKHYIGVKSKEEHYIEDYSIALDHVLAENGLPMFIHLDLNDDKAEEKLVEILELNPARNIILCHCGMNDIDNQYEAFDRAVKLQKEHNNLWLEISWVALDFLYKDLEKYNKMDSSRILMGTDLTDLDDKEDIDYRLKIFDFWMKKNDWYRNLLRVTGQEPHYLIPQK